MATNQTSTQASNQQRAPKKLLLKGLFTDASVRVEPEEPQKVLVAGLAEKRAQKEYPDTFFGRAFKIVRGEFMLLLKSSVFFMLFTLPFVLILMWFSGFFENLVLGNEFYFMADLNVGFHPGPGGDSLSESVARLLWEVKEPVVLIIGASLIFGSIGFSGAFYAAKRSFFQDYYSKPLRTYWMGFKKYWWVFLLMSCIGVLLGLAISTATIHLLTQQTLGVAGAGDYFAVVLSFVVGVPLMLVPMVALSIYVVYDLKLVDAFKNALVVIVNSPFMVFIVGALSVAPLLLCLAGAFLKIIVYGVMLVIGSNLLALCWIAMAHKGMLKCHYRKTEADKVEAVRQRQEAKREAKSNPTKKPSKPQNVYSNPKKKKKK